MNYIQVTVEILDKGIKDILIALLEDKGYEGFEEQESRLIAYIPENQYEKDTVSYVVGEFGLSFTTKSIAQQNWNAEWESNFQPVIVTNFCTVRASFHNIKVDTPYEIVITPKMSFGTGHHATTQLMMKQMSSLAFDNKTVLDFGTGTGILAILAEKLGSRSVMAIDNDEWSYENTKENIKTNGCANINVEIGSLEIVDGQYDIILANINRHILLHYMFDMYNKLSLRGTILMSGILIEDRQIILNAATEVGLNLFAEDVFDNWIVLAFNK